VTQTDLVANEGLLHRGQALEGSKEEVSVPGTANVLPEVSNLVGEGEQDLVFVVQAVMEERDELIARAVGTESEGNGRKTPHRVESEGDVLAAKLVEEDGDGVQLGLSGLLLLLYGSGHRVAVVCGDVGSSL
jgi:hypothetical protein